MDKLPDSLHFAGIGGIGMSGLAQMALAWVYSREGITSVLIGASKPEQIIENLKMSENLLFTEEELNLIDAIVLS